MAEWAHVGAGPVGLGSEVTDALAGEQLAEGAVLDVAERVVGHQPLRDHAAVGEPGECALDKAGHGRRGLVVVELDVGEAAVVVDGRVREVASDPGAWIHPVAAALGAITGDRVPGPLESPVAGRVHVQEVAGAGPLVAVRRLLRRPRGPRDAIPREHLRDRRMRPTALASNQSWPPPGAPADRADPLLDLRVEQARHPLRPARAIEQPGVRAALCRTGQQAAMPPPVRRRRRDIESGRGRSQRRAPSNHLGQSKPASRSELRSRVNLHPGPPSGGESWQTHSLRTGPDVLSTVHNLCGRLS